MSAIRHFAGWLTFQRIEPQRPGYLSPASITVISTPDRSLSAKHSA
jgi:hypothetical protein